MSKCVNLYLVISGHYFVVYYLVKPTHVHLVWKLAKSMCKKLILWTGILDKSWLESRGILFWKKWVITLSLLIKIALLAHLSPFFNKKNLFIECVFIMFDVFLQNCSYYWLFTAYLAYHINHPLFTSPSDTQVYVCAALFLVRFTFLYIQFAKIKVFNVQVFLYSISRFFFMKNLSD